MIPAPAVAGKNTKSAVGEILEMKYDDLEFKQPLQCDDYDDCSEFVFQQLSLL